MAIRAALFPLPTAEQESMASFPGRLMPIPRGWMFRGEPKWPDPRHAVGNAVEAVMLVIEMRNVVAAVLIVGCNRGKDIQTRCPTSEYGGFRGC